MSSALWLVLALVVVAGVGRLACEPLLAQISASPALAAALSGAAGLYLTSVLYFLSLATFGAPRTGLAIAEIVVLAAMSAVVLLIRRCGAPTLSTAVGNAGAVGPPGRRVGPALALAAGLGCVYTIGFVLRAVKAPHGYLDAVMTWNRGARFLFRDKEHWLNNFEVVGVIFLPDYPLLLQSTIARLWTYLGAESWVVPAALAYAFTVIAAAMLYGALARLRSRDIAALALCLLIGSTIFVKSAYNQVADVPIGAFMLASLVVLALGERRRIDELLRWAAAGAFAGGAAWVKNEGILFVLALGAALLVAGGVWPPSRKGLRRVAGYGLGAAVVMIPVLVLKLWLAPPSYLVVGGLDPLLARLVDASRYPFVLELMIREFLSFGYFLFPVLVLLSLVSGVERASLRAGSTLVGFWALVFLMAGYFVFYILTPFPLDWHVGTSFERLLVQILPLGLFLLFSIIRRPEIFLTGQQRAC